MNELITLYSQGMFAETLEKGAALAIQFPGVPFIPNLLGAANVGLGRLQQARACYAKALQLKPDFAEAHRNRSPVKEYPEEEIRKLLSYVGVDCQEQCLEFHKIKRAVHTASAIQLRQEMYQGSSEIWSKYEKHRQPMVELLRGF